MTPEEEIREKLTTVGIPGALEFLAKLIAEIRVVVDLLDKILNPPPASEGKEEEESGQSAPSRQRVRNRT
jgi:hypothetical protein